MATLSTLEAKSILEDLKKEAVLLKQLKNLYMGELERILMEHRILTSDLEKLKVSLLSAHEPDPGASHHSDISGLQCLHFLFVSFYCAIRARSAPLEAILFRPCGCSSLV